MQPTLSLLAVLTESDETYCGTTVEAAAEGWCYTTPLPGGRRVIAYLTDSDLFHGAAQTQDEWRHLLAKTRHVLGVAGSAALDARPRLFPAETAFRASLQGEGWVAVCDAAMSLDPLSSQGIATGLLMGARAGTALAARLLEEDHRVLGDWEQDYRMLLDEHETLRAYYAQSETRWPDSVFWERHRRLGSVYVLSGATIGGSAIVFTNRPSCRRPALRRPTCARCGVPGAVAMANREGPCPS